MSVDLSPAVIIFKFLRIIDGKLLILQKFWPKLNFSHVLEIFFGLSIVIQENKNAFHESYLTKELTY